MELICEKGVKCIYLIIEGGEPEIYYKLPNLTATIPVMAQREKEKIFYCKRRLKEIGYPEVIKTFKKECKHKQTGTLGDF